MVDPVTFLALLGTAAGMINAAYAAASYHSRPDGTPGPIPAEETLQIRKAGSESAERLSSDAANVAAIKVIPEPILSAFEKRLEKVVASFEDRIGKVMDLADLSDKAIYEVCEILANIRRFNRGRLPGEELEKYWKAFQCQS